MNSKPGPALSIRRYGRRDFEKFHQKSSSGPYLCVGSGSIGKVEVDCKYLWQDARWGVLGERKRPAGIIYIDISIRQPEGYWLENANVYITLSHDTTSFALGKPKTEYRGLLRDYDVQLTEHYGPQRLTGPKTTRKRDTSFSLHPEVAAGGVQLGGFGFKVDKSQELTSSWVFQGSLGRPKGQDGYRTLRWEFHGNHLDQKRAHNQNYQTAFTFEHDQEPVYMRIEVEGRLRSKSRQLKHGLLRFSSHLGGVDSSTVTQMTFEDVNCFKTSIDIAAADLNREMSMKNLQRTALEVPESQAATLDNSLLLTPTTSQDRSISREDTMKSDDIVNALQLQLNERQPDDAWSNMSQNATVVDDGEAPEEQQRAELEEPDSTLPTTRLIEETEETGETQQITTTEKDEAYEQFKQLAKIPGFVLLLKLVVYIIIYLF